MSSMAFNARNFSVDVGHESLRCLLVEPERLTERPALLLNFSLSPTANLQRETCDITTRLFAGAGHRVASFDMPCHGDRAASGQPQGVAGFCAEWANGTDVFARFVDEGHAVLDALIQCGLAEPGLTFTCGLSRGAYFALRLMAADRRIEAAAAFAPVTDWRVLREFDAVEDRAGLASLALTAFTHDLAERAVWIGIGNRDARVRTECCLRFVEALVSAEAARECAASRLMLYVVPEDGHRLSDKWQRAGGDYLLAMART